MEAGGVDRRPNALGKYAMQFARRWKPGRTRSKAPEHMIIERVSEGRTAENALLELIFMRVSRIPGGLGASSPGSFLAYRYVD